MKLKYITLSLFIGLTFGMSSCNSQKGEPQSKTTPTEAVDHSEHDGHASEEEITLNNGNKWEINAEMRPFLLGGEKLVKNFAGSEMEDYQKLALDLKEQDDQLIKSCTMKGESHEQLHKWLHPHLGLVDDLTKASSTEQSKQIVDKLMVSYQTFDKYFQ